MNIAIYNSETKKYIAELNDALFKGFNQIVFFTDTYCILSKFPVNNEKQELFMVLKEMETSYKDFVDLLNAHFVKGWKFREFLNISWEEAIIAVLNK